MITCGGVTINETRWNGQLIKTRAAERSRLRAWSSVRDSPKTTHFLVFRPIFGEGRLHLVWGSSIDRSSYAKSCLSQACSRLCRLRHCQLRLYSPSLERRRSREALPLTKATPHHHAHLLWSSTCNVSTARHCTDSTRIHPKMGSTLRFRGRVRAAGKPSDEPLRKGETQSLNVHPRNRGDAR